MVVYPNVLPLTRTPDARRLPEGPRSDRTSPFADDQPAGLRPYQPGDALRRIAWRASAHHQHLLVHELPPVRERATCLLVDLTLDHCIDRTQGPERALSVAASLASDAGIAARPLALATWAGMGGHGVQGGGH